MGAYLPDQPSVRAVAVDAELRNKHQLARRWLLNKIDAPPGDWDARTALSVPGPVWTVASDTCATGRLSAPENVAFDHHRREFVYRQPRNAHELQAVMSADSEEVFSCYRFDGLSRWTPGGVRAWLDDSEVYLRYAEATVRTAADGIPEALSDYATYLRSDEFREYVVALLRFLDGQKQRHA